VSLAVPLRKVPIAATPHGRGWWLAAVMIGLSAFVSSSAWATVPRVPALVHQANPPRAGRLTALRNRLFSLRRRAAVMQARWSKGGAEKALKRGHEERAGRLFGQAGSFWVQAFLLGLRSVGAPVQDLANAYDSHVRASILYRSSAYNWRKRDRKVTLIQWEHHALAQASLIEDLHNGRITPDEARRRLAPPWRYNVFVAHRWYGY
jgi:hypothetical protein